MGEAIARFVWTHAIQVAMALLVVLLVVSILALSDQPPEAPLRTPQQEVAPAWPATSFRST